MNIQNQLQDLGCYYFLFS